MKKYTVLVVEDDKWLAEQYQRILSRAGYKTIFTSHALSAINVIDDLPPDIIILDVLLTGSTAFSLLHELQSYGDTGEIPIVLCTNIAGELILEDLIPYGVKRIINKTTMKPQDIVTAIRGELP